MSYFVLVGLSQLVVLRRASPHDSSQVLDLEVLFSPIPQTPLHAVYDYPLRRLRNLSSQCRNLILKAIPNPTPPKTPPCTQPSVQPPLSLALGAPSSTTQSLPKP
ncbi:hypothetical protein K443DRAFT_16214 [Laccaria amethystina LaAM-08-1]|uniref:Uncharacterized protein n=1 Tax=Laccaria amethystina LaAM-08-1 TaxID=1095629 RepID=A0A0C9WPC8_9AGAR|nr:hypothetical protein K443DRAFT_16214 [Laccaria amethystina LaAM-08-1]